MTTHCNDDEEKKKKLTYESLPLEIVYDLIIPYLYYEEARLAFTSCLSKSFLMREKQEFALKKRSVILPPNREHYWTGGVNELLSSRNKREIFLSSRRTGKTSSILLFLYHKQANQDFLYWPSKIVLVSCCSAKEANDLKKQWRLFKIDMPGFRVIFTSSNDIFRYSGIKSFAYIIFDDYYGEINFSLIWLSKPCLRMLIITSPVGGLLYPEAVINQKFYQYPIKKKYVDEAPGYFRIEDTQI